MIFREQIEILATPAQVFDFLVRKHEVKRTEGSSVQRLDKITPGAPGVGTRYEEDVRMIPGLVVCIRSEITLCESGRALEEVFEGGGLIGTTRYRFTDSGRGTVLTHEQEMRFQGWRFPLNLVLPIVFGFAMRRRLRSIRDAIETGGGNG